MMKYPRAGSSQAPEGSFKPSEASMRLTTTKPSQLAIDSEPKSELLGRLARGQKEPIDKKEMKKLTTKNYQNLPEIKKKKEDEKLKKELAAKRERQVKYQKELDQRLREQILKKKKKNKLSPYRQQTTQDQKLMKYFEIQQQEAL